MSVSETEKSSISHRPIIRRALLTTLLAVIAWAPWAAWSNWAFGQQAATHAAITQVALSLVITLVMSLGVGYITAQDYHPFKQWVYSLLGPAFAMLLLMIVVHWLMGTPNWPLTIAPAIIIGVAYCTVCSFWLNGPGEVISNDEAYED